MILVFFLDNRFGVLPEAIHNALPAHHAGLVITDITLASCSTINILSSCKLDATKWHRINTDLYLSRGWVQHAYIHIERKREQDLTNNDRVIIDVRVGEADPVTSEKGQGAERWESRPGGIWLKRTPKRHASDSQKAITAVDVLFGADAVEPRPGWHIAKQPIRLNNPGDAEKARLTVRRGSPVPIEKPTLRVRKDGMFKILQVADLHFSTGVGTCRDPEPPSLDDSGKCEADPRTLDFIRSTLKSEQPDLVVLSGDQINGETSPDSQSTLFKVANVFIQAKIPFAAIFGNHDNEGSISREGLMGLLQTLPYSLSEPGPATIDGVGNYYIEVLGIGASSHSALTLYLLDTHSYSPDEHQFPGYDWIKKSQIDWFNSTTQSLRSSHSHEKYKHTHMDMAFIHIPLPEYRIQSDIVKASGDFPEAPTAPGFNSGFKDALVEAGVKAVSCGHDHVNDYCSLAQGEGKGGKPKPELWMCYAGGSGFGGYGGYRKYKRRVRVFELDFNAARITTWKRVEADPKDGGDRGRLHEIIIVDEGSVVSV